MNPDHLEAVTHRENVLRGQSLAAENVAKTHCPHGHAYDEENTYVKMIPGGGRWRICRACGRDANTRNYLRVKATR